MSLFSHYPVPRSSSSDEVICNHCRGTYELGRVTTVARYADCTMFIAPCCGRTVDDRSWKIFPDFTKIRDEIGYGTEYRDAAGYHEFVAREERG